MYTIYKKLLENNIMLLHKATYILQVVVIIYNKERESIVWNYHILYVSLYITVYIV